MTNGILLLAAYLVALLVLVKPLGLYMARVYKGDRTILSPVLAPVERAIYRLSGIHPEDGMSWQAYAGALLLFNLVGLAFLFLLLSFQHLLPLNPQGVKGVPPLLAFNTAVSFTTNTNWQNYAGETTLSHLSQMLGLTVQNFLSAATGMAVLVALLRGFTQIPRQDSGLPQNRTSALAQPRSQPTLGNFWVDLTRSILYILLPLAILLSVALVSQGVVQTLACQPQRPGTGWSPPHLPPRPCPSVRSPPRSPSNSSGRTGVVFSM